MDPPLRHFMTAVAEEDIDGDVLTTPNGPVFVDGSLPGGKTEGLLALLKQSASTAARLGEAGLTLSRSYSDAGGREEFNRSKVAVSLWMKKDVHVSVALRPMNGRRAVLIQSLVIMVDASPISNNTRVWLASLGEHPLVPIGPGSVLLARLENVIHADIRDDRVHDDVPAVFLRYLDQLNRKCPWCLARACRNLVLLPSPPSFFGTEYPVDMERWWDFDIPKTTEYLMSIRTMELMKGASLRIACDLVSASYSVPVSLVSDKQELDIRRAVLALGILKTRVIAPRVSCIASSAPWTCISSRSPASSWGMPRKRERGPVRSPLKRTRSSVGRRARRAEKRQSATDRANTIAAAVRAANYTNVSAHLRAARSFLEEYVRSGSRDIYGEALDNLKDCIIAGSEFERIVPDLCAVCFVELATHAPLCGHKSLCRDCARGISACVVCCEPVRQVIRIYDSGVTPDEGG